ncbi:hypothetical protein KL905_004467 [Ogataea polymorpha]|uniref:uncharacterized protein n=1 Tax=Ogataea polymorpha TaxID=460523 RepID=UPI0007F3D594|nr:uncharacterized protein OGAPODRAFT_17522 [Ogataea polymorpha]KAG7877993.1 hypothetical protein KL937_004140 [Ogataea polymorpha]KAG7896581.1 hypothetical protein KL908_001095 [Ogataea polymorpha]KAG7898358.1 hypothetical protein KL935_004508 [Ogataea polymorpha]KAG7916738.1 hypothetical protein KL905_004467 [Ogataea polymorpha]KAG7930783.1 hypothetical protein KL934_004408 [Ogataea polymorpha]
MAAYASQTVPQLKELLKQRGLPTNGVKADLIARLEESDKIEAQLDAGEESGARKDEPAPEKEPQPVDSKPEEKKQEPAAQKTAAGAEKPPQGAAAPDSKETPETAREEKKNLNPEELKQAAIELLNKKIARARKFGNEEDIAQLEASLKRIHKFGISLDSALARDLGFRPEKPRQPQGFKNGKKKWRK